MQAGSGNIPLTAHDSESPPMLHGVAVQSDKYTGWVKKKWLSKLIFTQPTLPVAWNSKVSKEKMSKMNNNSIQRVTTDVYSQRSHQRRVWFETVSITVTGAFQLSVLAATLGNGHVEWTSNQSGIQLPVGAFLGGIASDTRRHHTVFQSDVTLTCRLRRPFWVLGGITVKLFMPVGSTRSRTLNIGSRRCISVSRIVCRRGRGKWSNTT